VSSGVRSAMTRPDVPSARLVKQRAYKRRVAYTGLQNVDNTLVRAHVAKLTRKGWTRSAIAESAGIHRQVLNRAVRGSKRIHRSTHDAIMSVSLKLEPSAHLVDGLGTRRRLQALHAVGWDWASLATELGHVYPRSLQPLAVGTRPKVTRETAERVAVMYEQLASGRRPASRAEEIQVTRAKARALRYGWAPPLAWDCIDNPLEKPKGVRHAA
jgi:lambda repressor-like predicted transcriptional regulator